MSISSLLRDHHFQLITEFIKPDKKRRITLGNAVPAEGAFNIYRNKVGQILLDPVRTVPVSQGSFTKYHPFE